MAKAKTMSKVLPHLSKSYSPHSQGYLDTSSFNNDEVRTLEKCRRKTNKQVGKSLGVG